MPTVNIVEVGHVVVPPPEDLVVRLSALDAPWVTNPLIQRVLLFVDDAGGQQHPPFESLVGSLRVSLAATLARLPPFAGRVVFLPSTGDAAIDCSHSQGGGVRFVVAESDEADAGRLVGDADHDVDAFEALVPKLKADALPAEVLAVQVTRLKGGVAVGVALHHAVVDGRSVWMFLRAWAAACHGDAAAAVAAVTFDRAVVAIPGGEELARKHSAEVCAQSAA
ncbi:hypothetical protein CFC21_055140, partial [Triticum aestivum]